MGRSRERRLGIRLPFLIVSRMLSENDRNWENRLERNAGRGKMMTPFKHKPVNFAYVFLLTTKPYIICFLLRRTNKILKWLHEAPIVLGKTVRIEDWGKRNIQKICQKRLATCVEAFTAPLHIFLPAEVLGWCQLRWHQPQRPLEFSGWSIVTAILVLPRTVPMARYTETALYVPVFCYYVGTRLFLAACAWMTQNSG